MLPFGSMAPDRISANGILATGEYADKVGDLAIGMTLTFAMVSVPLLRAILSAISQ
jgi:hypothetical protein